MPNNKAEDKLFKAALQEGANISGVVSEEQAEEFDFL